MKAKPVSLSPVVSKAGALTIIDEKSMTKAVSILSQLNRERDRLTADKEKLTKPMNEALREIRSRYKPSEAKLDEAIGYVRGQISEYQTLTTERERNKLQQVADRIGDGMTIEEAVEEVGVMGGPIVKVDTTHGSVSFRTVQKWRITALSSVPREYLTPDEAAITAAMKQGTPVAGIEYYTEQQPINRR